MLTKVATVPPKLKGKGVKGGNSCYERRERTRVRVREREKGREEEVDRGVWRRLTDKSCTLGGRVQPV